MDRIITLSEKNASPDVEDFRIDENKFVEFMREYPIWTFFKISQTDYLSKPHGEKARLISEYYMAMSKGNTGMLFFIFFVCCLKAGRKIRIKRFFFAK